MEIAPTLCPHLEQTPELAYAGIAIDDVPHLACPSCFTNSCLELLRQELTPLEVSKLAHVPAEHLEPITLAMHRARVDLRECDSRISNRINTCKQHIWKQATKQKEQPRRYGFDDGRGPSYRRHKIVMPITEPKSLSSFSGVEVYNRREVTA